jgi:hypothetical protein
VAKDEGESSYTLSNLPDNSTYNVSAVYRGGLAILGTRMYIVTADSTDETQSESINCDTATGGTG